MLAVIPCVIVPELSKIWQIGLSGIVAGKPKARQRGRPSQIIFNMIIPCGLLFMGHMQMILGLEPIYA